MSDKQPVQNFITELRRGSLTLAVLGCLKRPHYGYAMQQTLQSCGVDVEPGTLYPLLRRLETQGLLTSDWDVSEARPRKYYALSDYGREIYAELKAEWEQMRVCMIAIEERG